MDYFLLYILEVGEIGEKGLGVSLLESVQKVRNKCLIAMICLKSECFIKAPKKSIKQKIKGCGAWFWGLWGCGGVCVVGVCCLIEVSKLIVCGLGYL